MPLPGILNMSLTGILNWYFRSSQNEPLIACGLLYNFGGIDLSTIHKLCTGAIELRIIGDVSPLTLILLFPEISIDVRNIVPDNVHCCLCLTNFKSVVQLK